MGEAARQGQLLAEWEASPAGREKMAFWDALASEASDVPDGPMQRGDFITIALRGDAGKPRPARVIQADHFINLQTLIVLPLTSTILDPPLVRMTVEYLGTVVMILWR